MNFKFKTILGLLCRYNILISSKQRVLMKLAELISKVYNKKVIEFILWNIRHSFIWRRRTRKLVPPSPYELVPNISQCKFNNLWLSQNCPQILLLSGALFYLSNISCVSNKSFEYKSSGDELWKKDENSIYSVYIQSSQRSIDKICFDDNSGHPFHKVWNIIKGYKKKHHSRCFGRNIPRAPDNFYSGFSIYQTEYEPFQ